MRTHTFSRSAGFSLLEVFLALGLALALGGLAVTRIKTDNETNQAKAVGDQLKATGNALNSYIAMRFNQLVAGTSVAGAGTVNDPGPRTCTASGGGYWCWVTSDTLRRNGLLPLSFSGRNAYGATYNYIIRVGGTSPAWIIDGLALTDTPYTVGGTAPRYDLLGEAMLVAGADSAMTRATASTFEGLNGSWQDTGFSTMMAAMTTTPGQSVSPGLLAFRAGYGSAGYAAYLRNDGGNAMTGDLNLGAHNITNAAHITATGNIQGAQLVGLGTGSVPNLVLGVAGNQTYFQQGAGSLTIRNTGGITLKDPSNNLIPIAASSILLGTGATTTTGFSASGTTITLTSNGSLATTGAGSITAGGTLASGGNATIGGNLLISGTATAGTSCAGAGRVAQNGTQLLQCKSSLWTPIGLGDTVKVAGAFTCTAGGTANAVCSAGYRLVGGGYALTSAAGNYYPPDMSQPLETSNPMTWQIRLNTTNPGCFRSYALCALL